MMDGTPIKGLTRRGFLSRSVAAGATFASSGSFVLGKDLVGGLEVNGPLSVRDYKNRAKLVVMEDAQAFTNVPDGAVVHAAGIGYRRSAGATAIADLPNWLPLGDVLPEHFADNERPGKTDMTAAINAAVDYGDTPGCDLLGYDYLISDPIIIRGKIESGRTEGFYFRGRGKEVSRIINSTPATDWLFVTKGFGLNTGWMTGQIENLSLVCDLSNRATISDGGAGIRLQRCLNATLTGIVMDAPTYPLYLENCGQTVIDGVYFRNNKRNGNARSVITFDRGPGGRTFGTFISNIEAQAGFDWEAGLDIKGTDGIYMTNSHINNVQRRVWIRPDGIAHNDRSYNVNITNTYFDGNGASKTGDGFVIAADMATHDVVLASVKAANVSAAHDTLTIPQHGIIDGQPLRISGRGIPGGLEADMTYTARVVDADTIKLASDPEDWRKGIHIDITSRGNGTHTLTGHVEIPISGIQMTGGFIRRGSSVFKLDGALRGLKRLEDVIVTGAEIQDFTSTWLLIHSDNLTDPAEQLQNFTFTGNIFEDGPANTARNQSLLVFGGRNLTFTGSVIQGNWTDDGDSLFRLKENTVNAVFGNNVIDVRRDEKNWFDIDPKVKNVRIDGKRL